MSSCKTGDLFAEIPCEEFDPGFVIGDTEMLDWNLLLAALNTHWRLELQLEDFDHEARAAALDLWSWGFDYYDIAEELVENGLE